MQQAIEQASRGIGRTAPNPPVGAIVVSDGQIIGRGFHPRAGEPHAEIFALNDAGAAARGAELYVTLEPCCHQGRTGPCTEAVISAGISKVYVGTVDPNPKVSGAGIAQLEAAGIKVVSAVLEDECRRLIAAFCKVVTAGMPQVIYKSALTLDGRTATTSGDSCWISSAESRALVHRLRDRVDAIMVGAGTVIADDPRLTTRLKEGGRDPVRVVIDGRLRTSPQAVVYTQHSLATTILITAADQPEAALERFRECGVKIIQVERGADGALDLVAAMRELAALGLHSVLLEGGATLAGAMLRAGLIDRLMLFYAPKLLAGSDGPGLFAGAGVAAIADAIPLTAMTVTQVGGDILLEGEVA